MSACFRAQTDEGDERVRLCVCARSCSNSCGWRDSLVQCGDYITRARMCVCCRPRARYTTVVCARVCVEWRLHSLGIFGACVFAADREHGIQLWSVCVYVWSGACI